MATSEVVDDAWNMKIPEFKPEDQKGEFAGGRFPSSFSVVFPKYREKYLKESFPLVQKALQQHFIKGELDLIEGSMTVTTTAKTWDPYIIVKARDLIRLLSRNVPYEQAIRVLEDEISCDIIKIKNLVHNREKFIKRRKRLIGPDGCTLKSLELLTNCYIMVHGATVAAIGPYKGLHAVRQIAEDTMKNIHPIYNIKALMIKKELMKDPNLKNEDWSRFLPKFESKHINKKSKKNVNKKRKEYTPFPPPMPESKIDKQLASGEYFELQRGKKIKKDVTSKMEKQQEKVEQVNRKRQSEFVPPVEGKLKKGEIPWVPIDAAVLRERMNKLKEMNEKDNKKINKYKNKNKN